MLRHALLDPASCIDNEQVLILEISKLSKSHYSNMHYEKYFSTKNSTFQRQQKGKTLESAIPCWALP